MTLKRIIPTALVLLVSLFSAQWAMAAAGTILLASGQAFVADIKGVQRNAIVGMTVESGETLLTRDGRAQIKFTDGGLISLQPGSEFQITDYKFQTAGKSEESAAFSFLKGGLRAITGLIGKRNKGDYRITTEMATIGIRGTEFKAAICDKNCKEPDGLYVQTGQGVVVVKNAFGEVEIGKGQTGYVPSAKEAPRRTSGAPTITAKATVSEPPTIAGVGTGAEFQPGTIISSNNIGELTALNGGGFGIAAAGTGTVTSLYHGSRTFDDAVVGAGAGVIDPNFASSFVAGVYLLDSELRGFALKLANGQFASITLPKPTNAGSDNTLYWGRWTNPTVSAFASLSGFVQAERLDATGANLHYILGTTVPTIPTSGSATYTFIGGTPSTDKGGGVGSGITAGSLTANFLASTVGASLTVSHGGTYSLTASGVPFNSNSRAGFSSDSGGTVSVPGASGSKLSGIFTGTNSPTAPSNAGVSYLINAASPIVGVGGFRCSSGC